MKPLHWMTLAFAGLALTACGGGHDSSAVNDPPATPAAFDEVPASAKASAAGYTSFAAGLRKSETDRPLDISQTTPPTSETAAPQPI